jgi:hypothetical protein
VHGRGDGVVNAGAREIGGLHRAAGKGGPETIEESAPVLPGTAEAAQEHPALGQAAASPEEA